MKAPSANGSLLARYGPLFALLIVLLALIAPERRYMTTDNSWREALLAPGPSEAEDLLSLERYWADRVTYPTGRFDPRWLQAAAVQDKRVLPALPLGLQSYVRAPNAPLALNANSFTSLGPQPQESNLCQAPCFTFGLVSGRVNAIAIDPTTTTPGLMTAYFGSDGGGVWKSTNCCDSATTWTVTT